MLRRALALAVLTAVLMACATEPARNPNRNEAAYLDGMRKWAQLMKYEGPELSDADLIAIGDEVCRDIANRISRYEIEQRLRPRYDLLTSAFFDNARTDLCRGILAAPVEPRYQAAIDALRANGIEVIPPEGDTERFVSYADNLCERGSPLTREKFYELARSYGPGREKAELYVDLVIHHVCPDKVFPGGVAIAPAPVTPALPVADFGDGIWEVGVDVQPGKYKTSGGSSCYWARLRSSETSDIIDNNVGAGPQTVVIKGGEYFLSRRCGTWSKAS